MADLEAVLERGRCSCGHGIGWHFTQGCQRDCRCRLPEHEAQATAVRAWLAEVLLSEATTAKVALAIEDSDSYFGSNWTDNATAALQAAVEVLGVRGE